MPSPDMLRITVKARGHHSGSMAHLRPGTKVIAEGPYGAFTPSLSGRRVLMIAGGVGITPIRAMFAALPKRVSEGVTLIYRATHPRDIVFRQELDAIATDRNATVCGASYTSQGHIQSLQSALDQRGVFLRGQPSS